MRLRAGTQDAKARGGWYPTRPPIGYRNAKLVGTNGVVKDRGGTIELLTAGRALLRRMYELRRRALPVANGHRVHAKRVHVTEAQLLAQFEAAVANIEMPSPRDLARAARDAQVVRPDWRARCDSNI